MDSVVNDAIIAAIIGALSGGAIAAIITGLSQSSQARRARREAASSSLWKYHYSLVAYAAQAGMHAGPSEERSLLSASLADVSEALRNAYPHAGYLREAARKRLFHEAWFLDLHGAADDYYAADHTFDEFDQLAKRLEYELMREFPQRVGDRCRSRAKERELKDKKS